MIIFTNTLNKYELWCQNKRQGVLKTKILDLQPSGITDLFRTSTCWMNVPRRSPSSLTFLPECCMSHRQVNKPDTEAQNNNYPPKAVPLPQWELFDWRTSYKRYVPASKFTLLSFSAGWRWMSVCEWKKVNVLKRRLHVSHGRNMSEAKQLVFRVINNERVQ